MRNRKQEPMEQAPRDLVDAALRDPEAFGGIIDRHKAMVFSLVFHFFQSRGLAEDIAQDVYLELYKNLHRIVSDVHLSFWLRQATTRKCIDYSRRLKHRRYQPLENVDEPGVDAAPRDPLLAETLSVLSSTRWTRRLPVMRIVTDTPTPRRRRSCPVTGGGGSNPCRNREAWILES